MRNKYLIWTVIKMKNTEMKMIVEGDCTQYCQSMYLKKVKMAMVVVHGFNSNIQWHRIYIAIPKGRKGCIVRNYWTKARLKPIRANSKSSKSMPDGKGLIIWFFQSSTPFGFLDCDILFSLELVPHPVFSSPWLSRLLHLQYLGVSSET